MSNANDEDKLDLLLSHVEILEDIEKWTQEQFSTHGYTIQANRSIVNGLCTYSKRVMLEKLFLEYSKAFRKANRSLPSGLLKINPATKDLIAVALDKILDDAWKVHLIEHNKILAYVPHLAWSDLESLASACTGSADKLTVHMLAHWVWQIKRKMRNLAVTNHLMLILCGKQGSGKSTAVELLLRPISPYKCDMAISALADERNYHTLQENFVIVSDEMHGCDKTDIEHLKQIITASTISARVLYTNTRDKISQNCTLIGTSNKSIDTIVRDDTGMRRFFCIECKDQIDWQLLNGIDFESIWKSVDENREDGYLPEVSDLLREIQDGYRFKDSVETYLDETGAVGIDRDKTISVNEIYSDYKMWCESSGFKAVDKNYFAKQTKRFGFESRRTSKARFILVSNTFTLWTTLQSYPSSRHLEPVKSSPK